MNLLEAIAVILTSLPVPKVDQDEPNRIQRLQSIAISIARASNKATCREEFKTEDCKPISGDVNELAAQLIVLANSESHLMRNVHADECGPHQCDAVRYRIKGVTHIVHRARSLWQLHRAPNWTDAHWEAIRGTTQEATNLAAWDVAKLLSGGRGLCGNTAGSFAAYATGGQCSHKSAQRRADKVTYFKARIQTLQRQPVDAELAAGDIQ
jgi:hypothetical protein